MQRAWIRAAATAAAAGFLLALSVTVPATAGDDVQYVALGDSFTAGPLIPSQLPDPPGCQRSDRNYPHLVAAALDLTLTDVSCSGATTADLFGPQSIPGGTNRPQLEAVTTTAGVVSVGIGGNDIGFSDIVRSCVAVVPVGRPCHDRFAAPGGDEISRRIAAVATRVRAVLVEIRRRAPSARIYVVGYPAILPEGTVGCWPVMPFAFEDVPYLRERLEELNAMLTEQAAAAGALYVDVYGSSLGHDACTLPGVKWVEPVVPTAPALPVHPNALGMRATAAVVGAAIDPRRAPPPDPLTHVDLQLEIDLG